MVHDQTACAHRSESEQTALRPAKGLKRQMELTVHTGTPRALKVLASRSAKMIIRDRTTNVLRAGRFPRLPIVTSPPYSGPPNYRDNSPVAPGTTGACVVLCWEVEFAFSAKALDECHWQSTYGDHILAHAKGGTTSLNNAQLLCRPCNSRKGAH